MSHKIVAIILVYNSADDARTCVDQLLGFNDDGLRVVIVDNCSPDGSFGLLRDAYADIDCVHVVKTDANRGYSAGNNFGIRYALQHYDFDTVAIMNPDVVIPQRSVFDDLADLLWSYDDCLVVGGQPINHLDGDRPWPSSWSLPTDREAMLNHCLLHHAPRRNDATEVASGILQVDCVVGCFFLAKAQRFAALGLFDESVFLYNEENILGVKCRRAGLRLLVDKNATYYHNHHMDAARKKTLGQKISHSRGGYRSRRYFVTTYYSTALRFPLWCMEAVNEAVILLGWLLHDAFRGRGDAR